MGVSVFLDPDGANLELAVSEDADFGRVPQELQLIRQGAFGVPRVVNVDRSAKRTMRLPLVVNTTGEGEDDLSDADVAAEFVSLVNQILAKPSTMYLQDTAQTRGVTFRTYPSPGIEVPTTRQFGLNAMLRPVCTVECEPYAIGDTDTIVDHAATTLPALVDLAAQNGEYETPLVWTLALANMKQVFLGLIEEQYNAWGGWLLDANALTWDTGGSAADGNAAGGAARKTAAGGAMSTAIDVTSFPEGEWAALVRARMTSGTAVLSNGTIGSDAAVTVSGSAYKWWNLGRVVLPTRRTYGGTATTTFTIDPVSTADAWVDRIAFVRASAGFVSYDGPAIDSFASDGEHVYVDGLADYRYVLGSPLFALRGRLAGIVEVAGGAASFAPVVDLESESLFNLWR